MTSQSDLDPVKLRPMRQCHPGRPGTQTKKRSSSMMTEVGLCI